MRKIQDFSQVPTEYHGLEDPDEYRKFMKWAPKYADCICVTCVGLDYPEVKSSKWGFLYDSVMDYEYTTQSPVTEGPEVMLLYLRINHTTSRWMREKRNIYDYMDPMIIKKDYFWLYDLCLVKKQKLEMCSCSHEQFCYISGEMLDAYKKSSR